MGFAFEAGQEFVFTLTPWNDFTNFWRSGQQHSVSALLRKVGKNGLLQFKGPLEFLPSLFRSTRPTRAGAAKFDGTQEIIGNCNYFLTCRFHHAGRGLAIPTAQPYSQLNS
jgi:hypothetical protein